MDGHGNNRTLQCIDRLMKAFAIANNVDTSVLEMGKKRRTPTEGGGGKKKRVKKEES